MHPHWGASLFCLYGVVGLFGYVVVGRPIIPQLFRARRGTKAAGAKRERSVLYDLDIHKRSKGC